jgi:hypothetical protein
MQIDIARELEKRLKKLGGDWLRGRFFPSTCTKLRGIGERLGMRRLVNLPGYPVR